MVKKIPKATITPDQLTLWEAPLQKVMQDMADDVLMNFIRHLMSQGTVTLSPINAYVWQLEKLRDFGLINQENIKIIAQYSGKTEAAINKLLINSGILVYNEARKEFEGNAPVAEVKEQLAAMANQTFLDINNIVNETLISTNGSGNVYQAYKEIIDKTVGEVFMGVLTSEKALRQTIQQWITERGGVGYFIDKGGHKWSFESYVNTVINSTSMRMYNEMRTQAARDYDIHTFYMSHHAAAREMCAPIQGHVVYDPRSGGTASDHSEFPNLSNYGLGTAGGTFGINCRHYLTPFIPGVNEMPSDKPVDPETAIKNGRKQAQQRQLERNVRNAKRDLKVAEAFGDDKAIMNAKLRIKRNQAALRQIVKDNDFLVRDYNREFFNVNNRKLLDELEAADKAARIERVTINKVKQEEHIVGTEAFKLREIQVQGTSKLLSGFTISADEINDIILEKADLGQAYEGHQYIEADKIVGFTEIIDKETRKPIRVNTKRIRIQQRGKKPHAYPSEED